MGMRDWRGVGSLILFVAMALGFLALTVLWLWYVFNEVPIAG
jgi:hypothetical protein